MKSLAIPFQIMHANLIISIVTLSSALTIQTQEPDGQAFNAPEEAVQTLKVALAAKDLNQLGLIFGSRLDEIVNPDRVQATNEFKMVASKIQESNSLVPAGTNRMALQFGAEKDLFPIPLVQSKGKWYFDTAAGVEELINRRIGRNEIEVLEIIRTYVQAQREYAAADRDGDEVLEYAQKLRSAPGQRDGLYWDPDTGGPLSPLGPMVAEAEEEGYQRTGTGSRQAFHGYYFKILTAQGKGAPGGEYNYIINSNMIGGFALVAWPADYDDTGVMTFIVNQQGVVFQKDLGTKTAEEAEAMTIYDPANWKPSAD